MKQLKRAAFSNALTKIINNELPLTAILESEELSATVRNEAKELLDYIFPSDEIDKENPNLPRLDELIQYSLNPADNDFTKYKLYQLNRNASNIFSSPSKKLFEFLRRDKTKRYFRALRGFMFNPNNRNKMFSGHFQRMFETALRLSADTLIDQDDKIHYNDNFNQKAFLTFIIKNADIISYNELLSTIINEFDEYFPDAIHETLRYAAICTLHIDIVQTDSAGLRQAETYKCTNKSDKERIKERMIKYQPVNCLKKPIATPYYLECYEGVQSEEKDEEFINKLKAEINFDEVDKSAIPIFLEQESFSIENSKWTLLSTYLLNSINKACSFDSLGKVIDLVEADTDAGKKSDILQYLLICGMYCQPESPLSYTAFNLIFNILNLQHLNMSNEPDDKYVLNLDPPSIIDEYAEHFTFDAYNVSSKMISALLVFWNHRYKSMPKNEEETVSQKARKREEKVSPFIPPSAIGYKPEACVSPLELLLPTVLSEPVYSSRLVTIYARIISSLEQEIIDAFDADYRNHGATDKAREERCYRIDAIWYELLSYRFSLIPFKENTTLIGALKKSLPLPNTQEFYARGHFEESHKIYSYRAPTNPLFFMLSNTINHGAFLSYRRGLEFRKILNISYSPEWVNQTMNYTHIIDRMEKQLIKIPYDKKKNQKKVDDKELDEDEIEDQKELAGKYQGLLTVSGRFVKK